MAHNAMSARILAAAVAPGLCRGALQRCGAACGAAVCQQQQQACGQRLISSSGQRQGADEGAHKGKPAGPPARSRRQGRALPPAVPEQQWVEVVDKSSGEIYYWNQSTGRAPPPLHPGALALLPRSQPGRNRKPLSSRMHHPGRADIGKVMSSMQQPSDAAADALLWRAGRRDDGHRGAPAGAGGAATASGAQLRRGEYHVVRGPGRDGRRCGPGVRNPWQAAWVSGTGGGGGRAPQEKGSIPCCMSPRSFKRARVEAFRNLRFRVVRSDKGRGAVCASLAHFQIALDS